MIGEAEMNAYYELTTEERDVCTVFVYGTLKRGGDLHSCMTTMGAEYLGDATVAGYKLISLVSFPGLVRDKESNVQGEVYEINREMLQYLDQVEGYPYLYDRIRVNVSGSDDIDWDNVYTYYLNDADGYVPSLAGLVVTTDDTTTNYTWSIEGVSDVISV